MKSQRTLNKVFCTLFILAFSAAVNAANTSTQLALIGAVPSADPIWGIALSPIYPSSNTSYVYAGAQDYSGSGWVNWYSSNLEYLGHISSADTIKGVAVSNDGKYVYTGTQSFPNNDGWINWYSINPNNGSLSYSGHIQSADVVNGVAASPNNLNTNKSYLYAGVQNTYADDYQGWINWYSINQSDGSLSYSGHISSADAITGVAVSPNGKFIYAAAEDYNKDTGWINWYSINQSDGSLTFLGHIPSDDIINGVTVSPDGALVYATSINYTNNNGTNSISWYQINPNNGSLTGVGSATTGSFMEGLAVSHDGNSLYTGISETGGFDFYGAINWYALANQGVEGVSNQLAK